MQREEARVYQELEAKTKLLADAQVKKFEQEKAVSGVFYLYYFHY